MPCSRCMQILTSCGRLQMQPRYTASRIRASPAHTTNHHNLCHLAHQVMCLQRCQPAASCSLEEVHTEQEQSLQGLRARSTATEGLEAGALGTQLVCVPARNLWDKVQCAEQQLTVSVGIQGRSALKCLDACIAMQAQQCARQCPIPKR